MIPLSRHSTAFATVLEEDADPLRIPANASNEDSPERIVRKLIHMVRNRAYDRRRFHVMLPSRSVRAGTLVVQGKTLKGVTVEVTNDEPEVNYAYDVDATNRRDSDYRTFTQPDLPLSFGVTIDNKIRLGFRTADDKLTFLNYVDRIPLKDDFVPAFKHLDEKTIDVQISARIENPNLINQRATPLCGPAVVGFFMAKYFKSEYRTFVKDLYNYAEAWFGVGRYLIKPRIGTPYLRQGPSARAVDSQALDLPEADLVLLTSIRSSENLLFPPETNVGGITGPWEVAKLLGSLLGSADVQSRTGWVKAPEPPIQMIQDAQAGHQEGYEYILLVRVALIESGTSGSPTLLHWVVFQGELQISVDEVSFRVFTWGERSGRVVRAKTSNFEKGFLGYIRCRFP